MENGELNRILRRFALFAGILLAIFSIWFSYDGLDQTVAGNNPTYSDAAKIAGAVVAIIMTLLQFIFNTSFSSLNLTLKFIGAASYVYSIYTNYLGIGHIFGFPLLINWFGAIIMDVLPESLISWSMGEQMRGDFLGNLIKMVMGSSSQGGGGNRHEMKKQYTFTPEQDTQPRMKMPVTHQSSPNPNKGKGRHFWEDQQNKGKKSDDKPSRFAGFGE